MEAEEESWSDEEVCVWVGGRRRWVSGVRGDTTCADLVKALLQHDKGSLGTSASRRPIEEEWVITERWRSVEQPLAPNATILDIWNAWGDAQSEIRFSLRYVESSGDSGCGSPPSRSPVSVRKRRSRHSRTLPNLLRAQGDTLHHQAYKLREQDKEISKLEEQAHKTRMAKHGPNYLLESYLRDIAKYQDGSSKKLTAKEAPEEKPSPPQDPVESQARSSEATDSPAGNNSDSGVGVSGSPQQQRPAKRRSRGRHLLREHYLTKELTDICQINANRFADANGNDNNSETSSDELTRVQQQIDVLERMAIVNKRLQREEELMVRLGAKLRRYLSEDHISIIDNEQEIVQMLSDIRQQMEDSSKQIEMTAVEMEKASDGLDKRRKMLEDLCRELEEVELESRALENHMQQLNDSTTVRSEEVRYDCVPAPPPHPLQHCNQPNPQIDLNKTQYVDLNYNFNNSVNYPLDTLV